MDDVVPGSRLDRLAKAEAIIRQLCERGMTQRQFGVSPALVTSWAKGKQTPSAAQLAALRELGSGRASEGQVETARGGDDH